MSEPTLGEVLRRLDEVARNMQALGQQMREDRVENASTFVRKDVYDARHIVLIDRLEDLETVNANRDKEARETRRQLTFIVLAAVISSLVSLLVSVYTATGGR